MWENNNDCAQIAELFFHYLPTAEDASMNNFFTVSKGKKLGTIENGWGPEFHLTFDYEQILPVQDVTFRVLKMKFFAGFIT